MHSLFSALLILSEVRKKTNPASLSFNAALCQALPNLFEPSQALWCRASLSAHCQALARRSKTLPRISKPFRAVPSFAACAKSSATCQTLPHIAKPCHALLSLAAPCQALPRITKVCHAMSSLTAHCQDLPRRTKLCCAVPSFAAPCQAF